MDSSLYRIFLEEGDVLRLCGQPKDHAWRQRKIECKAVRNKGRVNSVLEWRADETWFRTGAPSSRVNDRHAVCGGCESHRQTKLNVRASTYDVSLCPTTFVVSSLAIHQNTVDPWHKNRWYEGTVVVVGEMNKSGYTHRLFGQTWVEGKGSARRSAVRPSNALGS